MSQMSPESIVSFWRDAGPQRWFSKDEAFDAEVAHRYEEAWILAAAGALEEWRGAPVSALALVLVLDQFPRNMFRGTPRAFATDPMARDVAGQAVAFGFDLAVEHRMRPFFFLPFMHSEDLADQERCVALYAAAGEEDGLKWAREHRDIIARFGRFPHRNPILGRETTPDEAAFLAEGGFKG